MTIPIKPTSAVCAFCKTGLLPKAKICPACLIYVGFIRRWTHAVANLSGWIVAMITILTILSPKIIDYFVAHNDDIYITYLGIDYQNQVINIIASNTGSRGGTIKSATLEADISRVAAVSGIVSWDLGVKNNIVIKPGETEIIQLNTKDRILPKEAQRGDQSSQGTLTIKVVGFDGQEKESEPIKIRIAMP